MEQQYAPVSAEGDADIHGLDYNFLSGSSSGGYTSTVKNVLAYHMSEIKPGADIQGRKRIRELVQHHNNHLFNFMGSSTDISSSVIGLAETVFRRFSQDIPILTKPIKDLVFDTSANVVITNLNGQMNRDTGLSTTVADITAQLKWVLAQYKSTGEEVMRLEAYLTQKTEILDKHSQRIEAILALKTNSALPPLLDAFTAYSSEVFKEARFEDTYKELIETYKKWNALRDIISFSNVMNGQVREPMCSICLTDPVTHTIVPCGHTFCTACVRRVNISCYLCRGAVRERVKLFFT